MGLENLGEHTYPMPMKVVMNCKEMMFIANGAGEVSGHGINVGREKRRKGKMRETLL
jgi:hypothetical protein